MGKPGQMHRVALKKSKVGSSCGQATAAARRQGSIASDEASCPRACVTCSQRTDLVCWPPTILPALLCSACRPCPCAGPSRGAPALHPQGHLRRRLHLRTSEAAPLLHCGHLRPRPAAPHPQDSGSPHHVYPQPQVLDRAPARGNHGRRAAHIGAPLHQRRIGAVAALPQTCSSIHACMAGITGLPVGFPTGSPAASCRPFCSVFVTIPPSPHVYPLLPPLAVPLPLCFSPLCCPAPLCSPSSCCPLQCPT